MELNGKYSLRTIPQPIYNKAKIRDSSVTNQAKLSQQRQETCCLLSSSCRPLPWLRNALEGAPVQNRPCPVEPVARRMGFAKRRTPKHALSTMTASKGQLLTSSVNLLLMDFLGSSTQPWAGVPTGTKLTVDLVHATTRQSAPTGHPARQQQPLKTVDPWRTARSLGTGTFQTPTIASNIGIATMGRENTTSAQMTRLQENQCFMISSMTDATSRSTPTVVTVLYVTIATATADPPTTIPTTSASARQTAGTPTNSTAPSAGTAT